jgi:tetratricopeptide (TPR) repeat protein
MTHKKGFHMKKIAILLLQVFVIGIFMSSLIPGASCQAYASLQQGIQKYNEGNFDEAIDILRDVRDKNPESSVAAFYLGMAYKQLSLPTKASVHLEDAISLKPHVKEALPELIDTDLQMEQPREALRWLKLAQAEGITSPKLKSLYTIALLQEGIQLYKDESYEEAIEPLKQLRDREPTFSVAAFFLGMTYKQVGDFESASVNLEDAFTLKPPVKDAVVELIDVLCQMDNITEAKRWINIAEKEGILPPRVAFLKGMVYAKDNKNDEAIEAFEISKEIDPAIAQPADLQIALLYIKDKKLKTAKDRLKTTILYNPSTDLASFARYYQDMVEKRLYEERRVRLTIDILGGYDTNMLLKPIDAASSAGITNEESGFLNSSARIDYIPQLEGPWLFNAQFAFGSNLNQKNIHTHDSMVGTFSLSPGYNFGKVALNLFASYTDALLRTDPNLPPTGSSAGYKRYLNYFTYGPSLRILLTPSSILEGFAGYDKKEYFNQLILTPAANRDTEGPRFYISWVGFFKESGYVNLRYEFNKESADGIQWDNKGNRYLINASIPLLSDALSRRIGQLNLQLAGMIFLQRYRYEINYGAVTAIRYDKTYTVSAGLTWDFHKNASLIAQYTGTRCNSNVPVYDYKRNVCSAGFEIRF